MNEKIVQLLESIEESIDELDNPALDHVEANPHTVEKDIICGVCGERKPYGGTYIADAFEFPETPEDQEQERVCVDCIGRYLNSGEWRAKYNSKLRVEPDTYDLLWRNRPSDWSWDKFLRELLASTAPGFESELEGESS